MNINTDGKQIGVFLTPGEATLIVMYAEMALNVPTNMNSEEIKLKKMLLVIKSATAIVSP